MKTEPLLGPLATVTSPPSLRVMARPRPVPPNRWAVRGIGLTASPAAPSSCLCRCRPLLSRCLMSVGQASRLDMWASFRAMARPRTTKRLIPFSRESISRESHSESFSQGHKWNPQRFRRADQTPPSTYGNRLTAAFIFRAKTSRIRPGSAFSLFAASARPSCRCLR